MDFLTAPIENGRRVFVVPLRPLLVVSVWLRLWLKTVSASPQSLGKSR